MNWYLQSGKESDVVTSTRIRFSRNLQGFKFNLKTKTEMDKLKNKIKENVFAIGYGLKYLELKDMDDVTKMINTGLEGEKGFTSNVSESKTLTVSDSFTMTDNMGGFRLEILNGDGRFAAEIQGPVNGDSPQMICVPGDWRWPREWQKISDAYPDFVNWNSTNNAEWYKNSNSEYIY